MGIKKIARPINKAKNDFVQWLKDNNAESIDVYKGEYDGIEGGFDYYRSVSAFINDSFYTVRFIMYEGKVFIDYSDGSFKYNNLSLEDFRAFFWYN